jgi:uncharacterized protein YjiS (DUF1127 family)
MNVAAAPAKHVEQSAPRAVLGLVKSTYPLVAAAEAAVNDAHFSAAADIDAWARRAAAANGFGGSVVAEVATAVDHAALRAAAQDHRSASLAAIARAIVGAVGDALRAGLQRWREQRELRRTYLALSDLDARTLKDIAVGDQEIGSIAAELAGRAERTRVHAQRALKYLSI